MTFVFFIFLFDFFEKIITFTLLENRYFTLKMKEVFMESEPEKLSLGKEIIPCQSEEHCGEISSTIYLDLHLCYKCRENYVRSFGENPFSTQKSAWNFS